MTGTATELRSALFVDFDNVFSALCLQDPDAAEAFILEPRRWLEWITRYDTAHSGQSAAEAGPRRRILVRRCYLNPNGSLVLPNGERVFFGSFRNGLVQAGFQVVDCPPLTRGGKTSADIVLVMDVLDALHHATRFEEFILLSSDADFTPVLQRLRAHDRRTLVVAIGNAAEAYRAAADAVVSSGAFIGGALGQERARAALPEERRVPPPPAPLSLPQPPGGVLTNAAHVSRSIADGATDPAAVRETILSAVLEELARAHTPLHLPALGKRLQARLGPQVKTTEYGGAGSLARLLATAGDPRIELLPGPGGGWVRDPMRHPG